jgi:hypothetical protein
MAQHPLTLDVSTVVVGSERLETLYAFAMGKWSDAGNHVGLNSTEIHCYLRFGFCNVADASSSFGLASVNFTSYDILRWDKNEMVKGFFSFAAEKAGGREGYWNREIDETAP